MSDTVRADVRTLVATVLNDTGTGTYRPAGYDGTEAWPIHFRQVPAEPDEVLVVSCYGIGGAHQLGVQVLVQGNAESTVSAEDKADQVRTRLHGLTGLAYGATTLALLAFTSMAELGFDSNGREEITVNFAATTDDPNDSLVDVTP